MSTKKLQILGCVVPQADWNESNSESAAYIENKPFYEEIVPLNYVPLPNTDDVVPLAKTIGLTKGTNYIISYVLGETIVKTETITAIDAGDIEPTFAGLITLMSEELTLVDGLTVDDNDDPIIGDGVFYQFNNYSSDEVDMARIESVEFKKTIIHKMDSKFIDTLSTDDIADNAITKEKLKDGAVSGAKLGSRSVTSDKLAEQSVNNSHLANASVRTDHLTDDSVAAEKIQKDAIISAKIRSLAVTTSKIADNAITTNKIASGVVTSVKIADNAVTGDKVADNTLSHLSFKPLRLINKSEITENINSIVVNFNSTELKKYHHFCTVGEITSADTSATEQFFMFGIRRRSSDNIYPTNAIIRAPLDLSNNAKYSFVHFVKRYYIGELGSRNALYESELFVYDTYQHVVFHDKKISYHVDSKSVDFNSYDWIGIRTYLLKQMEDGVDHPVAFASGTNMETYLIEGV